MAAGGNLSPIIPPLGVGLMILGGITLAYGEWASCGEEKGQGRPTRVKHLKEFMID
jgi:hypothetical protein